MNRGIIISEYARVIREEKIYWWKNMFIPFIQVVSWQLIVLAHNFTEPGTDQLNQPELFNLWYPATEVNSDSAIGTLLFQHLHAISHWEIWG